MNRYRLIKSGEGWVTRRCPRTDVDGVMVGSIWCLRRCHYCKGVKSFLGLEFVKCSFKKSKI